jgi:hypothetical protein
MSGDDFLETLQADVLAILAAVPSLADVNIILEDDGDMEAKIMRKLGALTGGSSHKPGSVAVVMLPEVTAAEQNLPGPPVNVSVRVQVIEQHTVNRAASGSGVRSSEGALRVLAALHLQTLGYAVLYAAEKPVEPVEVKKGYLSHMVTLSLNYRGLTGPGKPAQVQAAMVENGMNVSGITHPLAANGFYAPTGALGYYGYPTYSNGTYAIRSVSYDEGEPYIAWFIEPVNVSGGNPYFQSEDNEEIATPDIASWQGYNGATGAPQVDNIASALILTCATAGAAIRYTTDGSYPAPDKTLYSNFLLLPEADTILRAAAYKTGMNPGDCTELLITE